MVEWKKLGEVCTILRGNRVTKGELVDNGKFPVISGGVTPMGFIDSYNREPNTITVSQYGTAGYVDFQYSRFWANDICYCVYPEKSVDNKYLWYVLKSKQDLLYAIRNTDATPYSLPVDTLKSILIPIPSLEEQTRIVGILDTFSSAIDNLKEQIAQRRKQYEYYRDQLLDLEGKEGVEMKTLGDVCIKTSNIRWKNTSDNEAFKYIDLSSVNRDTHTIDNVLEINKDNAPSRAQQIVYKGDVILGTTRPTLRRYCQIPQQYENQICSTGFCIYRANKDIVLNRWLFHNIGNRNFWDYCELKQQGAGYPCLSNSDAFAYIIPVPSLQEQQCIVSILDTFEASIQNLEAQLKERQKQYEYYRNKLLTFE